MFVSANIQTRAWTDKVGGAEELEVLEEQKGGGCDLTVYLLVLQLKLNELVLQLKLIVDHQQD